MEQIITDLDVLRTPAHPLEFLTEAGPDTTYGQEIIEKLKAALSENESLLAIAAPQIGIDARIFCIRFNDTIKTFINPIITKKSGHTIGAETFPSMPGKEIIISRPDEVTVVYYTDEFKYEDNKLIGPAARLFDQQAQLLDGVLPSDLGLVSDIETDGLVADLSDEEFEEVKQLYKQFIAAKQETVMKSIKEGQEEDLEKQYRQLKATEDVINGRIAIVEPEEEAKQRQILRESVIHNEKAKQAAQRKASQKAFISKKSKYGHKGRR